MIKTLNIKNFKSIKDLKLDCKKINLFIGKPNTGKSNILESVGIFSFPYSTNLREIVRFENMTNLFYDQDTSEKIEITADDIYCEIQFKNGHFMGKCEDKEKMPPRFNFDFNYNGQGSIGKISEEVSPFKVYKFAIMDKFQIQAYDFLLPPKGENLLSILLTNKTLRKFVAEILNEYGLKIVLKPQDSKIELQKEIEDVIISYPYSLVSDTLQRIILVLS